MEKRIKKIKIFSIGVLSLAFLATPLLITSCSFKQESAVINNLPTSLTVSKKDVINDKDILPSTVKSEFTNDSSIKTASKYLDIQNPDDYVLSFEVDNINDIEGSFTIKLSGTREDGSSFVQSYDFTDFMGMGDAKPTISANKNFNRDILPSKLKANVESGGIKITSYVNETNIPKDDKGNDFYNNISYAMSNINDRKGTFDIVGTYDHNGEYYGSTTVPFSGFKMNLMLPSFTAKPAQPSWSSLSGNEVKAQIEANPSKALDYVSVSNPDGFPITYSVDYDNDIDAKNGQLTLRANYSKNGQVGSWSHLYTGFYKYDESSVKSSVDTTTPFNPGYSGEHKPIDKFDLCANNFANNNKSSFALSKYVHVDANPNNYTFEYNISNNPAIDNDHGTLTINQNIIDKDGKRLGTHQITITNLFNYPAFTLTPGFEADYQGRPLALMPVYYTIMDYIHDAGQFKANIAKDAIPYENHYPTSWDYIRVNPNSGLNLTPITSDPNITDQWKLDHQKLIFQSWIEPILDFHNNVKTSQNISVKQPRSVAASLFNGYSVNTMKFLPSYTIHASGATTTVKNLYWINSPGSAGKYIQVSNDSFSYTDWNDNKINPYDVFYTTTTGQNTEGLTLSRDWLVGGNKDKSNESRHGDMTLFLKVTFQIYYAGHYKSDTINIAVDIKIH